MVVSISVLYKHYNQKERGINSSLEASASLLDGLHNALRLLYWLNRKLLHPQTINPDTVT